MEAFFLFCVGVFLFIVLCVTDALRWIIAAIILVIFLIGGVLVALLIISLCVLLILLFVEFIKKSWRKWKYHRRLKKRKHKAPPTV